jgi:hypothetical protein
VALGQTGRPTTIGTAAAGGTLLTVLDIHFKAFLFLLRERSRPVGSRLFCCCVFFFLGVTLFYASLISRCAVRLKNVVHPLYTALM